MKSVLVTGGAGFVGANLVRRLVSRGHSVNLLARKETDLWRLADIKKEINIQKGDLLDSTWLKKRLKSSKPDIIFNFAQYGGYFYQKDWERVAKTNLFGTVNLLAAAEEAGFEKFIHTGSSSEYGAKKKPMSEKDLLEPYGIYGVSKAAATLYCQHRGRDAKLPVITLRLFSPYGPWEEPARLVPTVLLKCLNGEALELVSPSVGRDFVYIDDVVDAYLAAMEKKNVQGEIVNVCAGKQGTLEEIGKMVLAITGAKIKINWGTYEKRNYDTDVWVGNPDFAKKFLGWEAKTGLRKGLKRTFDWIKNNQKLYAETRVRI